MFRTHIFYIDIFIILLVSHYAEAQCPSPDWKHWSGGYCYTKLPSQVPWTDASAACKSQGSELASILTEEENSFIRDSFTTGAKIGFNETLWIGMSRNPGERSKHFKWADGSVRSYTMFGPGEPNNIDANPNCIQFISDPVFWKEADRYGGKFGFWNDQDCNLPAYPLCKIVVNIPQKCEEGWSYYEGTNSCWKVLPTSIEWDPAKAECEAVGATLASIRDQAENDFAISVASTGQKQSVFNMTHIGADVKPRNFLGSFRWIDGTKWSWTHWEENEPNFSGQNSDSYCVMLVTDLCTEGHFYNRVGGWNDVTCSKKGETSHPLCKKPALS